MPVIREDETRLSIRQELTQPRSGGCGIERNIGFSGLENRQDRDQHRRTLVIEQNDPLRGAGGFLYSPGQTICPAVELGVGPGSGTALHGETVRICRGLLLESSSDRLFDFFLRKPEAHEGTVLSVPNHSASVNRSVGSSGSHPASPRLSQ